VGETVTSSGISAATLAQVEAATPGPDQPGATPRQIHHAVGMWALITVRQALRELVAQGRVTFTGADSHRLYRRP
jgi:hypothetical protein